MKNLKRVSIYILILIVGAGFILWQSYYSSDRVKVVVTPDKYTYQGEAEITGGKADINKATAQTLSKIDGIGMTMAERIVEDRNRHGEFDDISEIQNVYGIGSKTFEKIKEYICVN